MRQFLLVSDRLIALVLGALIVVVAISGSLIVFEGAMDRGLNPQLWHVRPGGAMASLDTVTAHAQSRVPGQSTDAISLSAAPDRAHVVEAGGSQVFVDPYSAKVLGTRTAAERNRSLPRRLHVLHVSLMAGRIGSTIVGAITIAALILVLTGAILWWPDKLWRVRWSASWKRIVFDAHHALGALAAAVLLIVTASGLIIHYETLNRLMRRLDDTTAPRSAPQPAPTVAGARTISTDSAYRAAIAALPGARVMFLQLPTETSESLVAAMRFPEDHTPAGRSRVFLDRFTGKPLLISSTRRAQLGTRLGNVMRSVHTGDVFGKTTEAIWLLATLILASQAITGALMWWNARSGRAALERRARASRVEVLGVAGVHANRV